MAISYVTAGTVAQGITSLTVPYPAVASGDLLVLAIANKYPTNSPSTPSGWTAPSGNQYSGGVGVAGADTGTVYSTIYTKISDGTESGNVTVTITSGNAAIGRIFRFSKASNADWYTICGGGSDNTTGVTHSITTGALQIQANDMVVVVTAINGNIRTQTVQALSQTGTTFGTMVEMQDSGTNNGDDCSLIVSRFPVSSGGANAAVTHTATNSAGTNTGGASVVLVLRETPDVSLSAAATITATGNLVKNASASLSGAATITANGELLTGGTTYDASASLSAAATITATGRVAKNASASLSATASITANAQVIKNASASLNGAATLSAVANLAKNASASLSGVATITATATIRKEASASLSAASTLSANANLAKNASASLNAVSTVTANGELVGGTINASASLSATATITANGQVVKNASASLSSVATITATGRIAKNASASLNASATITSNATLAKNASASLVAAGSLSANANLVKNAIAALNAVLTITATGGVVGGTTFNATASLSATGRILAYPRYLRAFEGSGNRLSITLDNGVFAIETDTSQVSNIFEKTSILATPDNTAFSTPQSRESISHE